MLFPLVSARPKSSRRPKDGAAVGKGFQLSAARANIVGCGVVQVNTDANVSDGARRAYKKLIRIIAFP